MYIYNHHSPSGKSYPTSCAWGHTSSLVGFLKFSDSPFRWAVLDMGAFVLRTGFRCMLCYTYTYVTVGALRNGVTVDSGFHNYVHPYYRFLHPTDSR